MDRIIQKRGWKTRLVGQIHDSMLFDVHPDELIELLRTVKKVCEVRLPNTWKWINVPLTIEIEMCDVDKSWYEKKAVSDSILKEIV